MQYAIRILENERQLLNNCLSTWFTNKYPEAKKEREKRLKSIKEAIDKLNSLKYADTLHT